MLQKQEEKIMNEEIDRDRLMAIEAQDKELAKLLYEKVSCSLSTVYLLFIVSKHAIFIVYLLVNRKKLN